MQCMTIFPRIFVFSGNSLFFRDIVNCYFNWFSNNFWISGLQCEMHSEKEFDFPLQLPKDISNFFLKFVETPKNAHLKFLGREINKKFPMSTLLNIKSSITALQNNSKTMKKCNFFPH